MSQLAAESDRSLRHLAAQGDAKASVLDACMSAANGGHCICEPDKPEPSEVMRWATMHDTIVHAGIAAGSSLEVIIDLLARDRKRLLDERVEYLRSETVGEVAARIFKQQAATKPQGVI